MILIAMDGVGKMTEEHDLFKSFVSQMNVELEKNAAADGRNQKESMEALFKLENKFRDVLISTADGRDVYKTFVDYIVKEKGNILSARVYFRERQSTFSANISTIFQNGKYQGLFTFSINYMFAKWVCDRYKGAKAKQLQVLLQKIADLRRILCENNLPLAINRAKIFWSKTQHSNLEYMDIIQNASEGLITAIDKYSGPYRTVFRSVIIGRMTLNILTDHNATLIKFSPRDRRILYRANNARIKKKAVEIEDILSYVQESFPDVTRNKLESIITAASETLRSNSADEDGEETESALAFIEHMPSHDKDAEVTLAVDDFIAKAKPIIDRMPLIQMKLIKLKMGLNYDENY
jgi:DNA-directed RNA polymerase specialized sigma subunit